MFFAALFLSLFVARGVAAGGDLTVRENPLRSGEYQVLQNGRPVGTIRDRSFRGSQSPLPLPHERKRATIHENPFRPGEADIRQDGDRIGTIRPDPFQQGESLLEDRTGARRGQVRQDPSLENRHDLKP
jgi:hypothetical protein